MISHKLLLKRTIPLVVQSALAHRKPRWLPVAKSKIYRIPKKPVVPEEERIELLRITNIYKTQMRAIRRFYFEEMMKEKETIESTTSDMSMKLEADDWEKCLALNEKWNAKCAAEREERRKKELADMEMKALEVIEKTDKEMQLRIEKASEEIRKQKELSATFITPETLDAAIDQALANTVDYNFAIDLKGNRFEGRDTPVTLKKEAEKVAAEA